MNPFIRAGLGGCAAVGILFGIAFGSALADDRPTFAERDVQTVQIVPYQAEGYRYQIIGPGETPPTGFELPDFDDVDFNVGRGAFGGGSGGLGNEDCPLQVNANTRWRAGSQLLVRRTIEIPAGARNVRVLVAIDNNLLVWFNGALLGSATHGNCPILDEFRFDVPADLVETDAPNVLVFHGIDDGRESFFDATVLAEFDNGPLRRALAAAEAQVAAPQRMLVSLADVQVEPCSPLTPDGSVQVRARFEVQGTEAEGEVVVTAQRGRVAVAHTLNRVPMYVTERTSQRGLVEVQVPPVRAPRRVDAVNGAAFSTLSRGAVPVGVVDCVATAELEKPGTTCRVGRLVGEDACNLYCAQEESAASVRCGDLDALPCDIERAQARTDAIACLAQCTEAAGAFEQRCQP